MTEPVDKKLPSSPQPQARAAIAGEALQKKNEPDPFPPEGTDEKTLRPGSEAELPISQDEAVRATQGVIRQGLPDQGEQPASWPNGRPANALNGGVKPI